MISNLSFCHLYGCNDVPDEGTNAYFFVTEIEFFDGLKERRHLLLFDYSDDTRVHLGPGVRTAAGFAAVGTTTLHLLEERKAFDTQYIQHIFISLLLSLL